MKEAIEKILNNFVLGDIKISYYDINIYPTPELKTSLYDAEIFAPLNIPMVDAETILERLKTCFTMLGFQSVSGNLFHDADRDKLLIRVTGTMRI